MINRKYLPSKNFLIALSVATVIIAVTIILSYWKPGAVKYKNIDTQSTSTSPLMIDSDDDGLPDWKENLYGTNSQKADTDGDGTNDADEVAFNREPLKANTAPKGEEPNDKIDLAIIEQEQKIMESYESLSDIAKFSRNLVSNIVATQPAKGTLDQSSIEALVNTSISSMPKKQYSGITKMEDLNLLSTNEANFAKNMADYTKSFYAETQKLAPLFLTDAPLIDAYVTDGSTSTRTKMLKLTNSFQTIVNTLIKMPVPVAIGYYDVNYHLTIINDLEKIIAIDKDVVNSDPNSLGIFSNISLYSNTYQNLFSTFKIIYGILKITK